MSFKTKNILWIIFWFIAPLIDARIKAPWFKFIDQPTEGYWFQLLGFVPFMLVSLYNIIYINERPLKSSISIGTKLNIISFLYMSYLMVYMLYKGIYLIPIYTSPLLFFTMGCLKHIRSFVPKK